MPRLFLSGFPAQHSVIHKHGYASQRKEIYTVNIICVGGFNDPGIIVLL